MKSNFDWFRVYTEARTDAKLRSLTDAQHRVWFDLLCFAAEQADERGCIRDYDLDLLAVECAGGDVGRLEDTLARLQKLRIVRIDDTAICFLHFAERQTDKPSDAPERVKERVTAFRERARTVPAAVDPDVDGVTSSAEGVTPAPPSYNVTPMKRDVTPGNAVKRREGDKTENAPPIVPPTGGTAVALPAEDDAGTARRAQPKPPRPVKTPVPDDFAVLTPARRAYAAQRTPLVDIEAETESLVLYLRQSGARYVDYEAFWQNCMRRKQEQLERDRPRGSPRPLARGSPAPELPEPSARWGADRVRNRRRREANERGDLAWRQHTEAEELAADQAWAETHLPPVERPRWEDCRHAASV